MLFSLVFVLVTLLLLMLLFFKPRHPVDELPGPLALPFFGNILMFVTNREEAFRRFNALAWRYYPRVYRTWLASVPVIHLLHPRHVEVVMASSQHISKSRDYDLLKDWLGTGLLTNRGSKWHQRRKLLTPAFHFRILENFLPVFCKHVEVLVTKMRAHLGNREGVDITPLVTRYALDTICETAMGTAINSQSSKDSDYVAAVYKINDLILHRLVRPWLYPDFLYQLTSQGRDYTKCLATLHAFTNKVIKDRKQELKKIRAENEGIFQQDDTEIEFGIKQRPAFLDLLLMAREEDDSLTEEDIRQEVDTFMFEGHDTTAMAVCWAIYFLGTNAAIQEKCAEELGEIFSGSDRTPTLADLGSMKYLERVIKETLRLRPSVYLINRKLDTTLELEGRKFPPNTKIQIHIFNIHRNPEFYPDPEKFNPDRFLPENCVGRHPYAYIPFSAGPRNCIGQRYAMMEMKVTLSSVLRHFRLEVVDPERCAQVLPDLVLRPKNGVRVRVTPREIKQ